MPVGQPSGGSIRRPSSRVSRISSEGWGKRQRGKEDEGDEGEEGGKDGGEDGGGEKRSEKKKHRSGKGVTGKEREGRKQREGRE